MNVRSKMQAVPTEANLLEKIEKLTQLVQSLIPQASGPVPPTPTDEGEHQREGRSAGTPRAMKMPLPAPRLLRRIIHHRQLRKKFFAPDLFADPAWDMLLDLSAARGEDRRVSVTSLCIASQVPPTTALRWIALMVEEGIFLRVSDKSDRRRVFIELSDASADAMARYFAETGTEAYR